MPKISPLISSIRSWLHEGATNYLIKLLREQALNIETWTYQWTQWLDHENIGFENSGHSAELFIYFTWQCLKALQFSIMGNNQTYWKWNLKRKIMFLFCLLQFCSRFINPGQDKQFEIFWLWDSNWNWVRVSRINYEGERIKKMLRVKWEFSNHLIFEFSLCNMGLLTFRNPSFKIRHLDY